MIRFKLVLFLASYPKSFTLEIYRTLPIQPIIMSHSHKTFPKMETRQITTHPIQINQELTSPKIIWLMSNTLYFQLIKHFLLNV